MNGLFTHGVGIVILAMMLTFIGIWIWAWLPYNRRTFDSLARMPMQDLARDTDSPPAANVPASDEGRR